MKKLLKQGSALAGSLILVGAVVTATGTNYLDVAVSIGAGLGLAALVLAIIGTIADIEP